MKWNSSPNMDDQNFDYPFGLSVFLSIVPAEQIENGRIDPSIGYNALEFVFGKLFRQTICSISI